MIQTATYSWEEANQICLTSALSSVRATLESLLSHSDEPVAAENGWSPSTKEVRALMQAPPALETLCTAFGLSGFERKVLLMCAGIELDSSFRKVAAVALNKQNPALPNFSLALAAFDDAHWSALLPASPLRYWHLVELTAGDALTTSPLRIDESVLHYLVGINSMDERLGRLTEPVRSMSELTPSQQAVTAKITAAWARRRGATFWPAVQLCGDDTASKRAVAFGACAALGMELRLMSTSAIPRSIAEIELFGRLWERESTLTPSALLLECDELTAADAAGESAVQRLIESVRTPLLISVRERRRSVAYSLPWFHVPRPTASEQLEAWREVLGKAAPALNGTVEKLASQFNLNAEDIRTVAAHTMDRTSRDSAAEAPMVEQDSASANDLASDLWDACRAYARPRLDGLAQRVESSADWDDLVLPERQKLLLQQIALHVRQRAKVYVDWGFAPNGTRGLGISALFAGPSGTGKTMAGEVLAKELRLDLYRVDLSQVVSKYIGETEKNLRRVFDAAEGGAAILLFDEADALFGKRSEVKDSHDRYANVEISYLLQRMEMYCGLAILTTNRREAIDTAFLRRIRFAVDFPFPDVAYRAEIWRRVFPPQTPTDSLRIDRLARLNAAGGNIRNIALGAAFLAADGAEPVRMPHLLQAARVEFAKLERPLTDSEIAGWI